MNRDRDDMIRPKVTPATLERAPRDGWVRADPWRPRPALDAALRGLSRAICPSTEDGAPSDPEVLEAVHRQMLQTFPYMSALARFGLPWAVRVLDWSPIFTFRATKRLHRLSPQRASEMLTRLGRSRFLLFRTCLMAARAAVLTAYFDLPAVHRAMGYDPVGFMRQRIALRQRLLDGAEPGDSHELTPSADALVSAAGDGA